jgi:hypothetical protein
MPKHYYLIVSAENCPDRYLCVAAASFADARHVAMDYCDVGELCSVAEFNKDTFFERVTPC